MAGAKGCMLEFNSDTKLTSEEFVKVFKEFDKDGRNMSILNIILYRHCGGLNCVLITSHLKYAQTIPHLLFLFSGNGYIEADELDQFLQTLLQETGNEVRYAVNNEKYSSKSSFGKSKRVNFAREKIKFSREANSLEILLAR